MEMEMRVIVLASPNLRWDAPFQQRLAAMEDVSEAEMVLVELASLVPEKTSENDCEEILVEKTDLASQNIAEPEKIYGRHLLLISMKIFLTDSSVSSMMKAVKTGLRQRGRSYVDTLILAIPADAIHLLKMGSRAGGPRQVDATRKVMVIWRGIEQLMREGKVLGAGLCDLHPAVFSSIYKQAAIKPTSLQVKDDIWVVPEELSSFAKSNQVTIGWHSDPLKMLTGNMVHPSLTRGTAPYFKTWFARYEVTMKDTGMNLEKRYIIELEQ